MRQILVFVLFAGILCWVMFAPIYKHVLIMREAVLQNEDDLLLETGASGEYGYINEAMIEASKTRLAERGFDSSKLSYTVATTTGQTGMSAANPVPRGEGLSLTITYPYGNVFAIDRLLGVRTPQSTERMSVSGMQMSEYVP